MKSKHPAAARCLNNGLFDGLNSFEDLEARISALPTTKDIGDAFEVFAEAYLATQKITQAQEVWPFSAIPMEQRQALSLDTGRDMGVDGTYQTLDGELRAYQVKFRSRRPVLTWEELSTFMGLTDQVSQRVLFTNCEALPDLMRDRSGFVAIRGSDLDRLATPDFEAMRQWLRGNQAELPRKQPLPHQEEAMARITEGLAEHDRATVVMACGTGKSLVALWAAERHDCKTLLVLVPSLALVRQLLHEWLRETAWTQFTFMCVCSDPTVAKGVDDYFVHQADLDFPVTTESAVVRQFLGKAFDGTRIVFSTYQSAQVVAEGMPLDAEGKAQPFDLAIFDEAHKTASREGTRFSFALEDANLPIRKRLFLTATPRHYDVRKKDKEGDNTLVYSMDKPEIYGPVIHTLSFAEAARRGIICDYKVVISVVTSAMVDDYLLRHGEVIVASDAVKARQVALQVALQNAVEKYGVSRIFTFHGSVKAARSFTAEDGEGIRHHLPEFTTLHVSGEMPTARREDQMKAFRQAQKAVMSNARCLTEGVDVPAVDMVAFISPRKSKVDIVQATGRAMRRSPGKEFGYVMVPLFVEQAANESIEDALKRTGFNDIWDLLAAMREQDDVLVDIIRQMQEDKGRTGGYNDSRFSERVEVMGPSVSLETIRGSITAECLESLGVSWDEWFGELLAYKLLHGNTNVPGNWPTKLGRWASHQREYNKKGVLGKDRAIRLGEIGFEWDILDNKWESMFDELVKYKSKHGHVNVPQKNPPTKLGLWVSTQRVMMKNGSLALDRKKRLELIGLQWDPVGAKWEEMFFKLLEYKKTNNNLNISSRESELGRWVSVQRRNYQNGILSTEHKARLEEIGLDWDVLEASWEKKHDGLVSFKNEHGHVNVPINWPDNLGIWVSIQRTSNKLGKLSSDRKKRLDELGFLWDAIEEKWEEMFNELIEYKSKNGCVVIPQRPSTPLGNWLRSQISRGRKDMLPPQKKLRLKSLGVCFEYSESKWDARFNELVEYIKNYDKPDVPQNHPTGLGRWVSRQRVARKNDELDNQTIARLDSVGFIWTQKVGRKPNGKG